MSGWVLILGVMIVIGCGLMATMLAMAAGWADAEQERLVRAMVGLSGQEVTGLPAQERGR